MQHDTTDRRTGRRTYLKALGAGTLTAGIAGVAGCLGAEAETRDNSNGESDNTANANEAQEGGEKADSPTATSSAGGSDGSSSEPAKCDILQSDLTAYDTAGTAFVFAFDYPSEWEQPETVGGDGSGGDIEWWQSKSFKDKDESMTGTNEAQLKLVQEYDGVTSARVSKDLDSLTTKPDSFDRTWEELEGLDFAGETVRVAATFGSDYSHYALYPPYKGSGGESKYYPISFSSYFLRDSEKLCTNTVRKLSDAMVRSFRPNPDSIIEEM